MGPHFPELESRRSCDWPALCSSDLETRPPNVGTNKQWSLIRYQSFNKLRVYETEANALQEAQV